LGEQMNLKRNSINAKFTIALLLVFILGSIIGGIALWNVLLRYAENQITDRGLVMIDMMTSVRNYTSTTIAPLLKPGQAQSTTFISPIIPAYSARTVFENYRKIANQIDFQNSVYKEASTNPTNPNDLADDFEAKLQQRMEQDANLKQVSDFTQKGGTNFYFIARPLRVSSDTCLVCHTTPDVAPVQLITSYGQKNGFGWKVGQIVAVQLIYVPANQVIANTLQSFMLVMGIFVFIYALVILLINTLLRRIVIRPVNALNTLAIKVGNDQVIETDIEAPELTWVITRNDELGKLSQVFKQMVQEVQARTQSLKEMVKNLQIEINESSMKNQVQEIVETEFFQDLQTRARGIREKRQASEAGRNENSIS
jgi:HAMP domain-containing protein